MSKAQKFFRYLWRINAVLILLAAGAIGLLAGFFLLEEIGRTAFRHREPDKGIPVVASSRDERLSLSRVSLVEGTNVMRADLQMETQGGKFSSGSSGYGTETRNILFIEPGEKTARWLLPDNDHVISDTSDFNEEKPRNDKRVIATAVLVRRAEETRESAEGRLLLFDAVGKKVVEVANNVREIHVTSINGGELTLLYERDRRLVSAAFDPRSLAKLREQEVEVPQLK
jgi:hypothetical protein